MTFVHFVTSSDKSPLAPLFQRGGFNAPFTKGGRAKRGEILIRGVACAVRTTDLFMSSEAKNLGLRLFASLRVTYECANLIWFDLVAHHSKKEGNYYESHL